MKISDLKVRQGNVEVEGTIKEVNEPRTFDKFGRQLRVADAILEDDSGTVKLTLWNDDIDKYKAGDKVKITNGYVNEFQGEKQLTAGKFGKMEKIGEGEAGGGEKVEEEQTEAKEEEKEGKESEVETPAEEKESENPEDVQELLEEDEEF